VLPRLLVDAVVFTDVVEQHTEGAGSVEVIVHPVVELFTCAFGEVSRGLVVLTSVGLVSEELELPMVEATPVL
jgi:hypothetical protein